MSKAIENLNTAVAAEATTTTEGLAAVESAFTELASDIAAIPAAADVQAAADKVVANTNVLKDAFGAFAQRLRDAIPTDAPSEPLPPADA